MKQCKEALSRCFLQLAADKGPADIGLIPVEMELMMACDKI